MTPRWRTSTKNLFPADTSVTTLNRNIQPISESYPILDCVPSRSPKCSVVAELVIVHWAQYRRIRRLNLVSDLLLEKGAFGACQNQVQELRHKPRFLQH